MPTASAPQAVEGQINLEKLQEEAHQHNMHRAEVKQLYHQVGAGGWMGGWVDGWASPDGWMTICCKHCTLLDACCLKRSVCPPPPPPCPGPPCRRRRLCLQGYRLRQRLQKMRERDPAAVLPEAEWQQWLQVGNSLRELDEVLPLDAQDWFAVSGVSGLWGTGQGAGGSGQRGQPASPTATTATAATAAAPAPTLH